MTTVEELAVMKNYYESMVDPRFVDYSVLYPKLPFRDALNKKERDMIQYSEEISVLYSAIRTLEQILVLEKARSIVGITL